METIYYTTKKTYIRPKKVVDLMEYRRSQQRDAILPAVTVHPAPDTDLYPLLSPEHREAPRGLFVRLCDVLDLIASLALTVSAVAAIYMLVG